MKSTKEVFSVQSEWHSQNMLLTLYDQAFLYYYLATIIIEKVLLM